MTIYRYVITADTGMAPAVDKGLISLATCKPVVRRCAAVGDWVVACLASPAPVGIVAWAGRIARKLDIGDYEREFRGRSDAVYRQRPDGSYERLRPDYHADSKQIKTDLSGPALLFDREAAWYFGAGPVPLPPHLLHLAPRGQGHRINGAQPDDEEALFDWLRSVGSPGIHGSPPDAERKCGPCGRPPSPPRARC